MLYLHTGIIMSLCQQTELFILPWFIPTDYSQVCSFLLVSLFTALTAFNLSWTLLHYCVGTPSVRSTASHLHWTCPSQQDELWPQTEVQSWIPHFHSPWAREPSPLSPVGQGRMPLPSGLVHKLQGAQENRREESGFVPLTPLPSHWASPPSLTVLMAQN